MSIMDPGDRFQVLGCCETRVPRTRVPTRLCFVTALEPPSSRASQIEQKADNMCVIVKTVPLGLIFLSCIGCILANLPWL